MNPNFKIGFGYDIHPLVKDRKLILGGVEIPGEYGLLGHSDADVLLHAICDAILGALALGDIGKHFPNTDPKYKDADSKQLLNQVYYLMNDFNYQIGNIDSTILLEEPKLALHIPAMRKVIANIINVDVDHVSVKATTSEKLGFVGRNEGCAAHAVVLLTKKEK
ncbi:MAG: 2-C-methyl-D-erythritol 2,4-cyclodiphosphate synthase [Ignavibacteriae bacterium HGW-Ignavibacteriae-3]|nr:MAG: 2-C-methyl-D-erythritol 2,4-cyclodiphosphate synthase [Ignavibacteriae bacterium HGW-Ignavibacteriae-3]